ncbi:Calcium-activated chloride channel [Fragilaria crotonensis]|nr:Calcium-activated chloride channel [Fragilaria crotonensis]
MYAIFITELLKTPITKVLDLPGQFYRHILARAPDQRRMNAYFRGAKYHLSERYTDMTNVLFLTFYYAMLFPAGFFWAAATLSVRYWVDKFCLLRSWSPAPALGTSIADLSRVFFFPGAVVAYAIMSSYNFASFPYDNACKLDDSVSSAYVGSFSGLTAAGQPVQFSIGEGESTFRYCNQDMLRYKPWPAFPAVPSSQPEDGEWMAPGQEFTVVFGWTSVVVGAFALLLYFNALRKFLRDFFYGGFASHDKPQSKGFSACSDIFGYIPQFKLEGGSISHAPVRRRWGQS